MKVGLGMRLHVLQHLLHVIACGEISARTAQDHQSNGSGLARDGIDMRLERLEHVLGKRIEFFGAIQGQRCRAAVILPSDQFAHNEAPLYDSTTRRRAPETMPPYRRSDSPGPAPMPTRLVGTAAPRSALRSQ